MSPIDSFTRPPPSLPFHHPPPPPPPTTPDRHHSISAQMELLNATVPEVGAWFDLDLTVGGGTGLSLAAKIIDTNMCGNFFHHFGPFWTISSIILDHFSRICQLHPTPHAPWATRYVVPVLIGC